MAQLTDAQLLAFFEQYLPNNDNELITPSVLRLVLAQLVESKASLERLGLFAPLADPRFTGTPQVPTAPAGTTSDQVASTAFVQAALLAIASGKNLSELALPQDVQGGNWYLTPTGFWEARRNFRAEAAPINGPNWRLLAGFAGQLTTLPVAGLSDATEAGRAMLTASSAAVQRGLVNNPQIRAGQYGSHPAFNTEDGPAGAWAWVFKAISALMSAQGMQQPDAPTNGVVIDAAKEFTFKVNPAYPSYTQYKEAGRLGTTAPAYLSAATAYQVGDTVHVTGLAGSAKESLAYYVGGSGNIPDGKVLTNSEGFSGSAVVTPPPTTGDTTPPSVQFTVPAPGATLAPNSQVLLTVTANDNVAVAGLAFTNGATGAVIGQGAKNGSTYTFPYTTGAAGALSLVATATDAAGNSQSATVNVTVQAAANRIPVADAGSDLTFQLPTNSAALMGRATDADGDAITGHAWRQITGPNNATGLPASTQNVVAGSLVEGTYQFGYRATDSRGGQSDEDYALVTVQAAAGAGGTLPVVLAMLTNSRGVYGFDANGNHLIPHSCNVDSPASNRIIDFVNQRFIKPTGKEGAACLGYSGKDFKYWLTQQYDPDVLADYGADLAAFVAKYPSTKFRVLWHFMMYENAPYNELPAAISQHYTDAITLLKSKGYSEFSMAAPVQRTDRTATQRGTYAQDRADFITEWSAQAKQDALGYYWVPNTVTPELVADNYANSLYCIGDGVHDSLTGIKRAASQAIAGYSYHGGVSFGPESGSPTLTGIALEGPTSGAKGAQLTYVAKASFSDGTVTTVTGQTVFSSDLGTFSGAVLTLPSTTSATAATITATYSGKSTSKGITVLDTSAPLIGNNTPVPLLKGNQYVTIDSDTGTIATATADASGFNGIAIGSYRLKGPGTIGWLISYLGNDGQFFAATTPDLVGEPTWQKRQPSAFYGQSSGGVGNVYNFDAHQDFSNLQLEQAMLWLRYSAIDGDTTQYSCQEYLNKVAIGAPYKVKAGKYLPISGLNNGARGQAYIVDGEYELNN